MSSFVVPPVFSRVWIEAYRFFQSKYIGFKMCFPLKNREKNMKVTWGSTRLAMAILMYCFLLFNKNWSSNPIAHL